MATPFAHLDPDRDSALHRRIVEISSEQLRRYGRPGAPVVWEGPAAVAGGVYGRKGLVPVTLSVSADGMVSCRPTGRGELLWCAHPGPPNSCRVRRGAFWVSRIDGREGDARIGRLHPFLAYFNDPRRVALPYAGAWELFQGRRRAEAFKGALRSVGARPG